MKENINKDHIIPGNISLTENGSHGDSQIQLAGVSKRFQDFIAVDNISFDIKKGEFFSLLGPSGCGKTTTLRMIAGLENPTVGKILLGGKDVTGIPAYKRDVNTVFQDYAIFPHMSVYDNIYFPLKMKKISKKEAAPKINRMLKLVNMNGFEKRFSHQLSGGQRQRIALARALVNEPEALLLDEPLGALDFKLRIAMQTVLKDIQRDLGITFIYVTHDQTEAITMSDRIVVMRQGVIDQIGTPDEIYNRPATPFVASFIGEMNFIDGKVLKVYPDKLIVQVANFPVTCLKNNYNMSEGQEVLVSIRPEKVYIRPKVKLLNEIEAKLSRIIFRGDNYQITASFNNFELVSVVAAKDFELSFNLDEKITIGWGIEDVLVFPIELKGNIIKYN
jgi:spermidine/putrescine transport system ATP-binding protein